MGRALDNAMLNVGLKDVARGMDVILNHYNNTTNLLD